MGCFSRASAVSLMTMSVYPIERFQPVAGDGFELPAKVDQVGGIDGRRDRHGGRRLLALDHSLGDRLCESG